ncbi:hypothetical protein BV898_13730 [Hypsibius exemplaris]|uniref:Zinc transporter 1 n=1 Tax=Hypsibius exemplaris TaxID=2072580 RepID=A0A1W0W9X5_HYPEX|nr:hypothetical protein BV898_13730 [Hypsibius exemplaris]
MPPPPDSVLVEPKHPAKGSHLIYLLMLLITNLAYFLSSLVMSHRTRSLTLRMDSNYVLFVVGSLVVSLIDLKLRNARSVKNTFGWARIEFLGNLFNATFLASLSFSSAVDAVQQVIHLSAHDSDGMQEAITVAILGGVRLLLGIVTFVIRYSIRDSCRHFRVSYTQNAGVELCVERPLSKAVTTSSSADSNGAVKVQNPPVIYPSVGVAIVRELIGPACILTCGLVYYIYGSDGNSWCVYLDPGVCLLQVLILGLTMFRAAKDSGLALMLTIPKHIDIHRVQDRLMEKFPQVLNIHDFHLWRTSRYHIIVTCHMVCTSLTEFGKVSHHIEVFLREEGITEVTIQPEVYKADTLDPQEGATMSPDACRCCDVSPTCCSLTGAKEPHHIRNRVIAPLPEETAELELPESSNDSSSRSSPSSGSKETVVLTARRAQ